ncbi:anti-sigma factor domain-containing protein [Qipengyuania gaetbuli]|uniref:anti-sigma factor n=1 Tax=Qipengyuania gaetbuli TaxID=266952 RepID=UPI001CFC481D|nr:anti-sigma factor [Qipengyuania gaetbuli]
MTDAPRPDDDTLTAEYALGLLEGEELLAARGREASDPSFAAAVAWWQDRLAPMLDEISPATPRAEVWRRIEEALDGAAPSAEVIDLRNRMRRWQVFGTVSAAAAAAIAVFAFTFMTLPTTPQVQPQAEAPLVASVPIADTDLRLAVTYLPDRGELLVSASGLTADGVHDHELWLVPQDDTPLLSLGVVAPGEERRVTLEPAVAAKMADGAPLLLTREPLGGKPEGVDAGPVVAEGQLKKI